MTTYLVTGATGFLGRHLVERLLQRPGAEVHALVRSGSQERLARLSRNWPNGDRVHPVVGDLTDELCGVSRDDRGRLDGVDHVIHLAALYDMTAGEDANEAINVDGTRHVVELAAELGAGRFHHVSSVAVAGEHRGLFTENMFDVGQRLPSPYHRTKFEAERVVREEARVPWRVYRPAIVVGHSQTGEMDKIDGPYYFFPIFSRVGELLPSWLRLVGADIGDTNLVPVDFVASAMDHLIHLEGADSRAFHLVSPRPQSFTEVYNAFAQEAGAPSIAVDLDRALVRPAAWAASVASQLPGVAETRDLAVAAVGVPPQVLPHMTFRPRFDATATQQALRESGISLPELSEYAPTLWRYWRDNLDPDRYSRDRPGGALAGRRVVITGASSGIGRETALKVAERGGIPLLVARSTDKLEELRREIEDRGGQAYVYSCDITDGESVDAAIKQMLADAGEAGVDMLVNNAGRSIRRSVRLAYDRLHDYERTMSLNYFGALRMILGLLPHFAERRFGHVVNVSSIGVQASPPRFSAYVASKAALDAFSRVVASETYGDNVTFTTIHMPLVRTPMIKPTKIYDSFPTITPDEAADMVVDALADRPKHVGTPLGTFAEVSYALAPKAVDAVLHLAYRIFPDSKAAGGGSGLPKTGPEATLSRGALAMAKFFRGIHW